jgi:glutathione S-transferase
MMLELSQEMNMINPIMAFHAKDGEKYKELHAAYYADLPRLLTASAKILGDRKFFGGAEPSYGDFAFFHICDCTQFVLPGWF